MLIIENGLVLLGKELKPVRTNLVIEDDKIIEITNNKFNHGKKIDATGCIVLPSFTNSHIHIADSFAKDIADGKSLDEIVKPPNGIKHRLLEKTPKEKIVESVKRSVKEMLMTGTTRFIDFREGGIEGIKLVRDAIKDLPIECKFLGRDPIFYNPNAKRNEVRKKTKNLLSYCDGVGLSGFGEIDDNIAKIVVSQCKKNKKIAAIHVAEDVKTQKISLKNTGKTEVQRALETGFDMLIHVTNPTSADIELLKNSDVSVVLCPRSNGILGTGIPPISNLLHLNINLLLGSDNVMFNAPNMIREMEYTLKVSRGFSRKYLDPKIVIKMATTNSLPIFGDVGCIEEGYRADILIVKKLSSNPWLSIINRLEPHDIHYVIKDGKIVNLAN
ncbi:S-adenosylhomocysteine deaminase [Methanothermus fervidus DSM 2088]|uniref:S-adenosylhomocysteine deaminase n=1 Tax=Methanothermus fervidus (strain ATCC 43054 / DSM 2088 / JCM 10308 / V24 S) TaxID=523846 RepID=E3GY79_METFV|nr:amidohydrolase family protein [Methanothermus fervidus]ADP77261.1 S-adenosylhomocysteine deaminase [Methanothermus fervidus DSM 2088]